MRWPPVDHAGGALDDREVGVVRPRGQVGDREAVHLESEAPATVW
jgi:hypothetical protein